MNLPFVGVTDHSYVNPLNLLAGQTPVDPGAFSGRLTTARRTLLAEWRKRSHALNPIFNRTDLLGALRYAGEVLARSDSERRVIIVLSDGRNFTPELDLETPTAINVEMSMKHVEKQKLIANLKGIEVFFFGAGDHSGTRGIVYAVGLQTYWTRFVERSGGSLKIFSTSRNPEDLRVIMQRDQVNQVRP